MDFGDEIKELLRELCEDAPPEGRLVMRLIAAAIREPLTVALALEAIAAELDAPRV